MDDNDNIIDFQKMNFSPFTTQFTGLPANSSLHQFTTAKFAQNLTTSNGQVVSVVSGADGNLQFLRSVNGAANFQSQTQPNQTQNMSQVQTFILPITIPGDEPGDAQQTVQIQVLNPNQIHNQAPKFQSIPMQLPIQGFQQPTVLTVSMPQDGEMQNNHGLPDGVTVLAAIQPQDLQLFAQTPHQLQQQINQHLGATTTTTTQTTSSANDQINGHMTHKDENQNREMNSITIKQEPIWQQSSNGIGSNDLNEFISRQGNVSNLQPFLKFYPESFQIKRDPSLPTVVDPSMIKTESNDSQELQSPQMHHQNDSLSDQITPPEPNAIEVDSKGKEKKKRKYKKKPPKPKPPKPGQVHIATALDGTILFCCPECQLAYPEKGDLEQHLTVHKIERRYICDICGAGLKRKEHLERHKLGHSPERPHICSVCMKGFKRKEHLNLHFVIHSGDKTEICVECGKGFYRKDHLRKHAKSHAAKRLKEELIAAATASSTPTTGTTPTTKLSSSSSSITSSSTNTTTSTTSLIHSNAQNRFNSNGTTVAPPENLLQQLQQQQHTGDSQTIFLEIPSSDNTTVPVQIKFPQLLTTSSADGTTNTVVLQQSMNQQQQQAIMSTAELHNTNHTTLTTSSAPSMIP